MTALHAGVYALRERSKPPNMTVQQDRGSRCSPRLFVLVENTEPSGHLYEIPHVAKLAECVTVFLQETGRGATWMFEDAYLKHRHWHKIEYLNGTLLQATRDAAKWAEGFVATFTADQKRALPWLTQPGTP